MADEEKTTEETHEKERSEFVDHMSKAAEATRKQWGSLIPDDFWTYGKEARKEFLLGVRTLVDNTIEELEKREGPATDGRKAKVRVE